MVEDLINRHLPPKSYADQWDVDGLKSEVQEKLGLDLPVADWADEEGVDQAAMTERVAAASDELMEEKTQAFGAEAMRQVEKQILLQTIDGKWREHLLRLDHLRSVIGFRGYAQRDPLNEYKNEAFALFETLLDGLREEVTQKLARIRPLSKEEQEAMMQQMLAQARAAAPAAAPVPVGAGAEEEPPTPLVADFDETDPKTWGNPGRNDPCPCGSGRKFKHCHGRLV